MNPEHHAVALFIAESLHSRLRALEDLHEKPVTLGIGFDDVSNFLDDAEDALTKIQNIEQTLQMYIVETQKIYNMCMQDNPNWLQIFLAILTLLEGEDAIKARRDDQLIIAITANLMTLETIEDLHKQEIETRGLGSPFEIIDEAKTIVRSVIDIKNTINAISMKFNLIREEIGQVRQWDAVTIIRLTINIIQIIEEEDIVKKHRDAALLDLIARITGTFEHVTDILKDFKPVVQRSRQPRKELKWQNQSAVDYYDYYNLNGRRTGTGRITDPRANAVTYPRNSNTYPSAYSSATDRNDSAVSFYSGAEDSASNWYGTRAVSTDSTTSWSQSQQVHLGNPISDALALIRQVMEAIEHIRNYERTIEKMTTRYDRIVNHIQKFNYSGNPRDIIPSLIEFIRVLKDEEKTKIRRDINLANMMKKITHGLQTAGYNIV